MRLIDTLRKISGPWRSLQVRTTPGGMTVGAVCGVALVFGMAVISGCEDENKAPVTPPGAAEPVAQMIVQNNAYAYDPRVNLCFAYGPSQDTYEHYKLRMMTYVPCTRRVLEEAGVLARTPAPVADGLKPNQVPTDPDAGPGDKVVTPEPDAPTLKAAPPAHRPHP